MSTAHAVPVSVKLPPPLRRRCDGDHKNALFCLVLQKISACMTAKPVACPLSRAGASGSSAATFISTRTCSGCCARAANSRTAAAPPCKLNEILWFADLGHYRRTGRSITGGSAYTKLPHGRCPKASSVRWRRSRMSTRSPPNRTSWIRQSGDGAPQPFFQRS